MRKKRNFIKNIFYACTTVVIFALLALFFLQKDSLVKQRNQLQICSQRLAELNNQNENLEIGFVEKNHLKNIESLAQHLDFEKTEKVHYIRVLGGTVVAK